MFRRILILLTAIAINTALGFSGGTGTPLDPYQIATAADLAAVNDNLSASYILTGNIDLSGITYDKAVIGHSNQFRGLLNGNRFKITGLKITTNKSNVGLIGQTSGATISNLGIEQAVISAGSQDNIAVLCGYSFNGSSIMNCYVTGTVSGGSSVGGLVGYNQTSSIENCYSLCNITGDSKGSRVGGLVGYNFNNSPVSDCYATGTIIGNESVGGLIGKNQAASIGNCYATGSASGKTYTGGLFGYNQSSTITNCYATGIITGDNNNGGLCGYNVGGSFSDCYAEGSVTGKSYNGGLCGYSVQGANFTECYATGTVTGIENKNEYNGGFFGRNEYGTVSYCYATGNVSGKNFSGGFTGYNNGSAMAICFAEGSVSANEYTGGFVGAINYGTVANSFASGNVTGLSYTGGFCGIMYGGTISNSYCVGFITASGDYIGCFLGVTWSGTLSKCFWDVETSGFDCDGFTGATGLPTAQMQDQNTFTNAGWNFSDIWVIPSAGYPQHKWLNIEVPMLGTGTKDDPYQIATQAHLEQVNKDLTAYYVVVADIDLSGTTYTTAVIAPDPDNSTYTNEGGPFIGSFDGNGYTISGLTIDTQGDNNNFLGLFGYISRGRVANIVIADASITGGSSSRYVGVLAGYNSTTVVTNSSTTGTITTGDKGGYYGGFIGRSGARIENCYSNVQITSGGSSYYVGGFIGYNYMTATVVGCSTDSYVYAANGSESIGGFIGRNWFGNISDCYSNASVQSGDDTLYIGCLCGYNAGTITGSYATGDITTSGSYVGDLCGYNYFGTLINCYAVGNIVTANSYVGGLCGTNFKGMFIDCYAAGKVAGNSNLGGLCATQTLAMTLGCFWDIETTGLDTSAGGSGQKTSQMQDMNTYLAAGWNFVNYWAINANEYPILLYPNIPLPTAPAKFSGGTGTLGNPYQIGKAADWVSLMNTSTVWDKYFIVIKNIDLKDVEISPIGNSSTSFSGSFDGCGFTVSNASMISGYDDQGLFGITNGAVISNLKIENAGIAGSDNVGGLIASASNTSVTNCTITANIAGKSHTGGLVGYSQNGTVIEECNADVILQGDAKCIGGLVGRNNNSTITDCITSGDVFGNGAELGGLAGRNENAGRIATSYSTVTVTGSGSTETAGGLVGLNSSSEIVDCYSTGNVTGYNRIGGFVGENLDGTIASCYSIAAKISSTGDGIIGGLVSVDTNGTVTGSFWDATVSGIDKSAAGKGLATAEMQNAETYLSNYWDFDNIWWMPTADYPKLQKEMKGTGTQSDPYQIENQFQLERVNSNLTKKHYILMADIDLAGTTYTTAVIAPDTNSATSAFEGTSFSGVFNGNGHHISGLNINTNGEKKYYIGLFGRVNDGSVKNLALENININAGDNSWYIGGLAGWNNSVMLTNCYTTGQITTGQYSETIGGLAGENRGTITSCYSEVTLNTGRGAKFIGGLVGWNGMAGSSPRPGVISNCYAKGVVNGTIGSYANPWSYGGSGGLVGANWYGLISDSYSLTQLSNAQKIGGLCGYTNNGTISYCFWNIETTGIATSSGGTGLTTAQMFDNQTFVTAGWNLDTAWMQLVNEYPKLIFEDSLFPQDAKPMNANNIDMVMFVAQNWLSPVGDTTIDLNQSSDQALVDMQIFSTLSNQTENE